MDPERWEQIVGLYEEASRRDPATRSAFLAEACRGDEELCREVQSLLDQDVTTPGLLESVASWTSGPRSPASVGAYRILSLIGEGGMGVVYEAEQESPRRIVALKVVKPGLAVPEILRRFQQESHALGRLQHPGIAQIHEAGSAHGKPYFAMERIHGRPLLEYAAAHKLTTPQRLDLMIKILEATQHAHERGIIHRDLKPSNILVDETGQPKILDFGVARITDADTRMTRGTDLGQLIGTLCYMSPEQIRADPDLDARSDIYALGLILYELLAGRMPYETGRQLTEAASIICEQDPYPLGLLNRGFRGDLQTITAKALEKDKGRRYASAAEFALDISRHLANRPILARPPSAFYRARKFVRRHKALTSSAAVVFVILLAGILLTGWQAARARRAEQTAQAVSAFLQTDLLSQASSQSQASPDTAPDRDLKVRTALDRAAARIPGRFGAQPEVEAAIRQTIGTTYNELGLYQEAQIHLERSLELRRRVSGEEHPDTLSTMQELGELYIGAGKYAQAEAILAPLLATRRRKLGEYHQDTLRAMNDLAAVINYRGDYTQAAELRARVLASDRQVLGPEHPYTLVALSNLASTYSSLGRYSEAAELFQQTIDIDKRVFGMNHPTTFSDMNGLAGVYRKQGDYVKAEALLREVLEGRRRTLGEEHHDTLLAVYHLALAFMAQGRYTDAEPLLQHGLETGRRALPDHPDSVSFLPALSEVYWKEGRTAQAESLFREALAAHRRVLGPNHPLTANVLVSMGEMKLEQKQYSQAEPILLEAIGIYEKSPLKDWRLDYSQAMRAEVIAHLGRRAEAGPLLSSAYDALVQKKNLIPAEKRSIVDTVQSWKLRLQ
ncbi:MAG TPA: serine/threonine-protein kinase [Bryobacteraceae bacterium]|nr:serine/threonine-protein kinase [Bryobacteraceae bacterium]